MKYSFYLLSLLLFSNSCSLFGNDDDDSINHPPTIYNISVDINDVALTSEQEDKLFREYAEFLSNSEGSNKLNAHPEFYLDPGYKVFAVSPGKVSQIIELEGPDDMLILIKPDDAPGWLIGYEHVSNVIVEVGDRISVEQVLADVSPYKEGLGKTALMVLHGSSGNSSDGITSYCPFMLLDVSVKDGIMTDIMSHVQSWEQSYGDVYNDHEWVAVGCNFEKMTEEEARNASLTH